MVDMINLLEDKAFDGCEEELPVERFQQIVAKRRLWKNQIIRCHEIYRVIKMNDADLERSKKFRLDVKKRLFLENRETLDGFESPAEKVKELHTMYTTLLADYRVIIHKLMQNGRCC